MKVLWSDFAIEKVTQIAEFIAQENLAAAEKWVESIFKHTCQL